MTWVVKVEHIALVEGHLKRDQPPSPEATRRGDGKATGEGAAPLHPAGWAICCTRFRSCAAL